MFPNGKLCMWLLVSLVCLLRRINAGPVVDIPNGQIEGTSVTFSGNSVNIYKGIKYAEPPTGSLRFLPPEPKLPWTPAVYDATEYGPSCPQDLSGSEAGSTLPNTDIDEDCLLLNIYAPANASEGSDLSTMVYLHGGGLSVGQGMATDGTVLASLHDVIIVTVNYRLGVLGFLSTEDSYAPGNYGILDQILALTWVKDNIGYFGGSADHVTIFGNSAGSYSTHVLSLSPEGDGLFQRVISQSGALYYSDAVTVDDAATNAELLGTELGCENVEDHENLVACLRVTPSDDILAAQASIEMGLVVDGDVITSSYESFVANSTTFGNYDHLFGTNSYEGASFFAAIPIDLTQGMPQQLFDAATLAIVQSWYSYNQEGIAAAASYAYTDWYNPFDDVIRRDEYGDMTGDITFVAPTVKAAREHVTQSGSTGSNTYHYNFDHRSSYSTSPAYIDGAEHTEEVAYVFGELLAYADDESSKYANATTEEIELSYKIMEYWTNFAKTGVPNSGQTNYIAVTWPEFDNTDEYYLHLTTNITQESQKQRLRADKTAFWLDYVQTNLAVDTCSSVVPSDSTIPSAKPVIIFLSFFFYILQLCIH